MGERKGARSRAGISADILAQLNAGTLQTASLSEGLAVDFVALLRGVCPQINDAALADWDATAGITRRMSAAARLLRQVRPDAFEHLCSHASDTVRGWAAYALADRPDLDLASRLSLIRPLADDAHFGVREWAWLALRPHVAAEIEEAVGILATWTTEDSANLRRFAVEITRPRGVWCAHIERLKKEPKLGLPVLTPLRGDPARYVQNSVANWLNDAARTEPDWVRGLCKKWQARGRNKATDYICKRALRSLVNE